MKQYDSELTHAECIRSATGIVKQVAIIQMSGGKVEEPLSTLYAIAVKYLTAEFIFTND